MGGGARVYLLGGVWGSRLNAEKTSVILVTLCCPNRSGGRLTRGLLMILHETVSSEESDLESSKLDVIKLCRCSNPTANRPLRKAWPDESNPTEIFRALINAFQSFAFLGSSAAITI